MVAIGYQEHVGLGRRFASRVQELLGGASESELRLIASTRNRTIDSAKGFREVIASYFLPTFVNCKANGNETHHFDDCTIVCNWQRSLTKSQSRSLFCQCE